MAFRSGSSYINRRRIRRVNSFQRDSPYKQVILTTAAFLFLLFVSLCVLSRNSRVGQFPIATSPRPPLIFSNDTSTLTRVQQKPAKKQKTIRKNKVDRNIQIRAQEEAIKRQQKKCAENTNSTFLPMCPNAWNIAAFTAFCGKAKKRGTYFSSRWGNVISSYWAARTMAELGGYSYEGAPFGEGSWMEYLPTTAEAVPPKPDLFELACQCESPDGDFHACTHSAGYIGETIANGTRTAIRKFAATQSQEIQDAIFKWNATDWLIYDRCCLRCPPQGFVNIHAFDVLPKEGSFTVYTLTQKDADKYEGHGLCGKLHQLRDEYIMKHNSNIRIVPLEGTSLFVDWSRCIFVPNYLSASAGSSWLFYTSLANTGNVYVGRPQLRRPFVRSAMPARLHIFEDDAMTPPQAERLLNMTLDEGDLEEQYAKFISTRKGQEMVLKWFVNDTGMKVDMDKITRQE